MNQRSLSLEQLKTYIEWDVVNWSKALPFWERYADLYGQPLKCLELGARRGGLSLWLASKGHDVLCSDYEDPRIEAAKLHSQFVVPGTIRYGSIDATNIPYDNHFDVIAFKSILGGISRNGNSHLNKVVVNQIHKALKPGGRLIFAENLEASLVHKFLRRRLTKWGAYWNYLKLDGVQEIFSDYSSLELNSVGFLGTFGRNEFQRNFLGKVDSIFFDKLMPIRAKYILLGVASKERQSP